MHCVKSQIKYLMFFLQLTLGWPELRQLDEHPIWAILPAHFEKELFGFRQKMRAIFPFPLFLSATPALVSLSLSQSLSSSLPLPLPSHCPSSLPFFSPLYSHSLFPSFPTLLPSLFPFPRAPLGESSHLEITKSKTVLRRYGSNDYSKHLLWWTVMWHLKCLYCLSHKFGGQLFQPNQHYS